MPETAISGHIIRSIGIGLRPQVFCQGGQPFAFAFAFGGGCHKVNEWVDKGGVRAGWV